ncbi:MAG TPA: hypothetical protein VF791_03075 [Pyrinomonadaceae bacterium]
MISQKCSKCGFVSFATAGNCKSCDADLSGNPAQPVAAASEGVSDVGRSRLSISPLRILILVLLVVGTYWYFYQKEDQKRIADEQRQKKLDEESPLHRAVRMRHLRCMDCD